MKVKRITGMSAVSGSAFIGKTQVGDTDKIFSGGLGQRFGLTRNRMK